MVRQSDPIEQILSIAREFRHALLAKGHSVINRRRMEFTRCVDSLDVSMPNAGQELLRELSQFGYQNIEFVRERPITINFLEYVIFTVEVDDLVGTGLAECEDW